MNRITRTLALTVAAGLGLAACADNDAVVQPAADLPGGELFARYVALGNSITAGFQSGGITASTQLESYPVYLARQAGAPFNAPLLNPPGCPAPLVAPFSTQRATLPGETVSPACSFRARPAAGPIQNLAVPGAVIASALDIAPAANALTTFILGGRTPADWVDILQPSLVSVWLGNNDALGAALTGNLAVLNTAEAFEASLNGLAQRLQAAGPRDAIMIGVVDPVVVPALQPGVFAWLVKQNPATAPLLPNPVNNNCAPVGPTGAPNPLAQNLVSLQIVGQLVPGTTQFLEISCANDAPFVLTPAESNTISQRVAAFNQRIEARAQANGWIYVNPNQLLGPFLADPNAIRKCQGLPAALQSGNQQAVATAVANTCPSPSPAVGFGNLFSFDAVHPSARAHRIVTNDLIARLNAKHGLAIPTIAVN